jgi:hypothetical protein
MIDFSRVCTASSSCAIKKSCIFGSYSATVNIVGMLRASVTSRNLASSVQTGVTRTGRLSRSSMQVVPTIDGPAGIFHELRRAFRAKG